LSHSLGDIGVTKTGIVVFIVAGKVIGSVIHSNSNDFLSNIDYIASLFITIIIGSALNSFGLLPQSMPSSPSHNVELRALGLTSSIDPPTPE